MIIPIRLTSVLARWRMPYAVEENLRGMAERKNERKKERKKERMKERQRLGLFTIRLQRPRLLRLNISVL